MKKRITIKDIICLQAVIVIYTISSVVAKFASNQEPWSFEFFLFYGGEIVVLMVYAFFWQQMIKKFDLSIAYANRAMVLLWSMVWAVIIFHNKITLQNILGVALVIAGTIIVNTDNNAENSTDNDTDNNANNNAENSADNDTDNNAENSADNNADNSTDNNTNNNAGNDIQNNLKSDIEENPIENSSKGDGK